MRIALFLFLITICLNAFAQDLPAFEKKTFTSSAGHTLPYRILYPDHYKKNKKYPLVLFLHGSGERGDNNESQLVHGARLFLDSLNREKYPALVLFPQCTAEGYWASVKINRTQLPLDLEFDYNRPITHDLQAAIELVEKIRATEKINKKRIYVAGLSMGGMGTFEAAYRFPNLFAAAVAICGGADVEAYDKRVSKIPFRIFHGQKDDVVEIRHSRAIVEKLKTLDASVEYIEYPKANHNSWDSAFAEPDFLEWLFTKKRRR